jgi:hypothetical protein
VHFYKDEQGLPYIYLEGSEQDAAMMLVQEHAVSSEVVNGEGTSLIQTIRGNYEGYTRKEELWMREAQKAQAMLGNPSKKDFKGIVSSNIIPSNITNA